MRKAFRVFHNTTAFVLDLGLQVFVVMNTHDNQFLLHCQLHFIVSCNCQDFNRASSATTSENAHPYSLLLNSRKPCKDRCFHQVSPSCLEAHNFILVNRRSNDNSLLLYDYTWVFANVYRSQNLCTSPGC